MSSVDPWGSPIVPHILRVEALKSLVSRMLYLDRDLACDFDVDVRLVPEMHSMVVELTAFVAASKREDWNEWDHTKVPARPVRDGFLLWLSKRRFVPFRDRLERKIQWRTITTQIHHLTYYGCPHLNVPKGQPVQHLSWLESGGK